MLGNEKMEKGRQTDSGLGHVYNSDSFQLAKLDAVKGALIQARGIISERTKEGPHRKSGA